MGIHSLPPEGASTKSLPLRRTASVAIAIAGLLHLILVPEYLKEAWPLGISFLLSAFITGWVAVVLWRQDRRVAWVVGALTSAGIILGFVLSRTVGLLGYRSSEWAEGIPSVLAEIAFLGLRVRRAAPRPRGRAGAAAELSVSPLRRPRPS